jgi:hypothetical protein
MANNLFNAQFFSELLYQRVNIFSKQPKMDIYLFIYFIKDL